MIGNHAMRETLWLQCLAVLIVMHDLVVVSKAIQWERIR